MKFTARSGVNVTIRRSHLWIAGMRLETMERLAKEGCFGADVAALDIEDTVPVQHKPQARETVAEALTTLDFGRTERSVRINGPTSEFFEDDIAAIIPTKPDIVRLPKVSSVEEMWLTDRLFAEAEKETGLEVGTTEILLHIENPQAVRCAYELATQTPRVVAMILSGEDYTESIHARRTYGLGPEMLYGRGKILVDARAADVQPLDAIYMDVGNPEGFREEAIMVHDMGFEGKSCLDENQVKIANEIFVPSEEEIDFSRRAVSAYDQAISERSPDEFELNSGVLPYVDGTLIGPPVAAKARRVASMAEALMEA